MDCSFSPPAPCNIYKVRQYSPIYTMTEPIRPSELLKTSPHDRPLAAAESGSTSFARNMIQNPEFRIKSIVQFCYSGSHDAQPEAHVAAGGRAHPDSEIPPSTKKLPRTALAAVD